MPVAFANPRTKATRHMPRHRHYLADAQLLLRNVQRIAWKHNWHATLGGGVLNHGYSDKDIDLYLLPIYPREGDTGHNETRLLEQLSTVLGKPQRDYLVPSQESEQVEAYGATGDAVTPTCFVAARNYAVRATHLQMSVDVFVVRP